jgi:hypothetical protein
MGNRGGWVNDRDEMGIVCQSSPECLPYEPACSSAVANA